MCILKPEKKYPGLERGTGQEEVPPLAEELLEINSCWERESIFFMGMIPDRSTYAKVRPPPKSAWEAQIELSGLKKTERIKNHKFGQVRK